MPDDDGPTPEQSEEYHRLLDAYRADRSPANKQALERWMIQNRYGNEMGPAADPDAPAAGT